MNLKLVGITATVNVFSSSGVSLTDIKTKVEASLADYETLLSIGEVLAPQKDRGTDGGCRQVGHPGRYTIVSKRDGRATVLRKVKFNLSPMMSNITYTYVAG